MFFGAGFNFISAILMLFFIGLIWGSPSSVPLITNVNKGSKAAVAGLEKGDIIKEINAVTPFDEFSGAFRFLILTILSHIYP